MDNMFENIAPSISKFTSECVPVGEHGVIDLSNEREVIDAYKKLQEFLKDEISKTGATKFTPAQMEHAQRGRAKAKRELEELKPYINPAKLARLDAEFRNLGTSTQTLSEQRSNNMDKKIDEGFKDAIAEFMDLAGVYEDEAPCEDVDFDACFNIECEDKPEMSDEMGLELKDNDEEELDESIRDFLPKAGAFRNDDGKMIGGFIGNGSKDRIEKAKKIAKAKFYNGDRMGRVTDEELDNFDEVYADLMHRAGRDPELDESIRDFLPKAGAFRNDDGKMIGGFIGNGSKDRIEKAKKIAKAKFYNGDRMGRVTDEEIDNFDEVYADLMHRAGRDPELDETSHPKSYLKPINETTAGDGRFSDKELAQIGAITRKPTKKFKIYQNPMGEIVVTDHVLDKSWALMDEADTIDEIEDKILSDWEDANAVGYDKHILNYPEVASLPQFEDPMHDDDYFWDVSEYYEPITEATEVETAGIDDFEVNTPEENPVDVIRMDVPLFMRCLEFSREDAQDDADLHHLVEKAVELSKDGKTLTMDNYDELAGGVSEGIVDEAKDPNVDAEWKAVKQSTLKEGCPVRRKWKRIEKKSK